MPSSPTISKHSSTSNPPPTDTDLEMSMPTDHMDSSDPYSLRSRMRDPSSIAELRKRGASKKKRHVGDFYEQQNEKIELLLKSIATHAQEGADESEENSLKVKIAIRASFFANCILAILQLYAAISSLSLSFFATAADSVFDPGANFILNRLHKNSKKVDLAKYPVGGARLTTIGNIVYAFAMLTVSIILVAFSIQDLSTHKDGETLELHIPSVVAVSVAFLTKFLLFLYCFSIRNSSSQVQVLWEDHRNDLFINGLGILTSSAGAKLLWWIDPFGAIIISLAIIISWSTTAYEQFDHLAGKAAPIEYNQLVIYKALTFSEDITQIDSCRVYHSGEKYIVEVDIVMSGDTPLWKTHDISQDLQDQLETLPMVERAFVHVDHEVSHKPEHRKTA
ncbi:cation diffusion facilitator 1 [Dendrothele bispora CBS 962.96]|uniref:Cation diffusion facilitator 1 n=1 Tax=Dendrothele bispora (strain CBS 962.96) TaxID=1314807 RepID=A0A4S8MJT1_DENBC|nr:cation diffusion facilitator 1 [Dendrothele bispora CBS 962.96]